jgi:hypothetical protein
MERETVSETSDAEFILAKLIVRKDFSSRLISSPLNRQKVNLVGTPPTPFL